MPTTKLVADYAIILVKMMSDSPGTTITQNVPLVGTESSHYYTVLEDNKRQNNENTPRRHLIKGVIHSNDDGPRIGL